MNPPLELEIPSPTKPYGEAAARHRMVNKTIDILSTMSGGNESDTLALVHDVLAQIDPDLASARARAQLLEDAILSIFNNSTFHRGSKALMVQKCLNELPMRLVYQSTGYSSSNIQTIRRKCPISRNIHVYSEKEPGELDIDDELDDLDETDRIDESRQLLQIHRIQ